MVVRGQSMEPSFPDGSRARVTRLAYWLRGPARGDVIILRCPEDPARLELKRVIGLPRETIQWDGRGAFAVNGVPLAEPYARMAAQVPGDDEQRACALGPRAYFVAGDHRLYSRDSRHYGPVHRRSVFGKARACVTMNASQ